MQPEAIDIRDLRIAKDPAAPRTGRAVKRPLGELLIAQELLTEEQLRTAQEAREKRGGGTLAHLLVEMGFVGVADMGRALETTLGVPYVDPNAYAPNPEIARLLSEGLIRQKMLLPLEVDNDHIWLAMVDPLDLDVIDAVGMQVGRRVVPLLSMPTELLKAINRIFDVRERTEEVLREIMPDIAEDDPALAKDEKDEVPLVRLVNTIIDAAFDAGASDIHLEPQEDGMRVRYRLDGVLHEQTVIPRASQNAVISRIKVIGGMDIAERRRPQDGRISRRHEARQFDLRVSTMPTVFGEKVVLRILDKSAMNVPLAKVGFLPDELERWNHLISRPYGIVLVTGPTGSGKSTTLYASLNQINDPGKNISTIEDPVEYQLKGINQTQVNARAGVTFPVGLRTLLRQDPDIILVGEVRDKETAEVAINAALTGHLVFATLHTNDASGAMIRLDNMGVEPFLVASAIQGVIGQRLLRKICNGCREWYSPDPAILDSLDLPHAQPDGSPTRFARGRGCRECGGKGFRGRSAVFEVLTMSDETRTMVLRRDSSFVIKEQAIKDGMRQMRDSALIKVMQGVTTPEEVARVILSEGGH